VFDLITAGDAFDDLVFFDLAALPRRGQQLKSGAFTRSPGGGAVRTALAAARLGLRCAIVSGLSTDAADLLRREGITITNLRRRDEPVAVSVALSTRRDKSYVTFNGMNERLPSRIRAALPRLRARHVHFAFGPRPCRPWIRLVEDLRTRGVTTSWDFGWNPSLARDPHFRRLAAAVDYLFLNRDEALLYARHGELARALARWRRNPRPVIVKLGAGGSRLVGGGANLHVSSVRARSEPIANHGDAFNAGFLAARLRGADIVTALTLANRVGAVAAARTAGSARRARPAGARSRRG
jgi:sugar/nucleoside kinase (ribokinase family)